MLIISMIKKGEDTLRQELAKIAPDQRAFYLFQFYDRMSTASSTTQWLQCSLAALYAAQKGLVYDFKTLLLALRQAKEFFQKQSSENRLLKAYARKAETAAANLLFNSGHYHEAQTTYQTLIAEESNKERKAILRLNLARAHMAQGNIGLSLRAILALQPEDLSESHQVYSSLLQSRLLLNLGFNKQSEKALEHIRKIKLYSPKLELEFHYLACMSQISIFEINNIASTYQVFMDWLATSRSSAALAFYQLEWCLLELVLWPASISNQRLFLDKIRHLSKKADCPELGSLAKTLLRISLKDKDLQRDYDTLRAGFMDLLSTGHQHLFFFLLLAVAKSSIQNRQYAWTKELLSDFDLNLSRLEAGISQKTLKELCHQGSDWRSLRQDLEVSLPQKEKPNFLLT